MGRVSANRSFSIRCFLRFFDPRHTKIDFSRCENAFFVKFMKFYVEKCGIEQKIFFRLFHFFVNFWKNLQGKKHVLSPIQENYVPKDSFYYGCLFCIVNFVQKLNPREMGVILWNHHFWGIAFLKKILSTEDGPNLASDHSFQRIFSRATRIRVNLGWKNRFSYV